MKYRKQYTRVFIEKDSGKIIHIYTNDTPISNDPLGLADNPKYISKDIEFERPIVDSGFFEAGHIAASKFFKFDDKGEIVDCFLEHKNGEILIKDDMPKELRDKIKNFKNIKKK